MKFAVVLSLLLHVASYLWWGLRDTHPLSETPVLKVTLTHQSYPKPTPVVVAPAPPPVVKPKPVVPETKPRPVPRRVTPRVRKAPASVTTAPVSEATAAEPAFTRPVTPAVQQSPAGPTADQLRERYLSLVHEHIKRHKFYPAIARRQGLEGTVHVSFVLSAAGTVDDLQLLSGPKLLRHAAEEILRRALPLPSPPAGFEPPLRVEYLMPFQLQ